jgi:hypothetical protein
MKISGIRFDDGINSLGQQMAIPRQHRKDDATAPGKPAKETRTDTKTFPGHDPIDPTGHGRQQAAGEHNFHGVRDGN